MLAEGEAKGLAQAMITAVGSLPAVKKRKAMKMMREWMPWGALVMTAYGITAPRVVATLQAQQQARQAQEAPPLRAWEALGVDSVG